MIKYKETTDIGFKRRDFGNDSVWFNEFGYDWFITEKLIIKKGKFEIIANWNPNMMEIEVMHIQNEIVVARMFFNDIEIYKSFESFFIPIAI